MCLPSLNERRKGSEGESYRIGAWMNNVGLLWQRDTSENIMYIMYIMYNYVITYYVPNRVLICW